MTQCAFDQGPQVKRHGRATVRHPALEGQELALGDIEAVTGEGIEEGNEVRVKEVLADFEADIAQFLLAMPSEAEIAAAAAKVVLFAYVDGIERES